jgi:antitoxin (DNA-binding transcriptional repressor) of toxin-antitoxin stability system
MKHIKDEVTLSGKLESITMMDLRLQPGAVIDSVELGKTFVITKMGKPVAVLSRLPGEILTLTIDEKGHKSYVW